MIRAPQIINFNFIINVFKGVPKEISLCLCVICEGRENAADDKWPHLIGFNEAFSPRIAAWRRLEKVEFPSFEMISSAPSQSWHGFANRPLGVREFTFLLGPIRRWFIYNVRRRNVFDSRLSLCARSQIFTFSSNMKTSHSLVSQHNFKQASADATSSSLRNFAPIAFDSSVRMMVDEWMSNRSAIDD